MKQISNQALMFLLVASIVVSVVGTITNVQRLGSITSPQQQITGFSTTGTGKVNVTIAAVTSITISDGLLDFGSCSPNITGSYIESNSSNSSWNNVGVCTVAGSAPTYTDSLNVTNDGNDDVNITVSANLVADDFIGGTGPQFMFSVRNVSARPGCSNRSTSSSNVFNDTTSNSTGMQWKWMNFSSTTLEYSVCDNLTFPDTTDAIALYARLFLPSDIASGQGDKNVTITFTATSLT